MEIESKIELKFIRKLATRFWLGARREMDSGLWYWQKSGKIINFAIFTSPDYGSHGEEVAYCDYFSFKASNGTQSPSYNRYSRPKGELRKQTKSYSGWLVRPSVG